MSLLWTKRQLLCPYFGQRDSYCVLTLNKETGSLSLLWIKRQVLSSYFGQRNRYSAYTLDNITHREAAVR